MNVGAAGARAGLGGGNYETTGSFGRRTSMLKPHEEERAKKDELVITNIPFFRYFVAITFLAIGIVIGATQELQPWSIVIMVICIIGFILALLLCWTEVLSLKHSTGTITQSKYLFCKRVRHLELKLKDVTHIGKLEKCYKLAFVLQIISESRSVKALRTRLPWEQDTNHMLIKHWQKHFMEQKGEQNPDQTAKEAQIKVEMTDR